MFFCCSMSYWPNKERKKGRVIKNLPKYNLELLSLSLFKVTNVLNIVVFNNLQCKGMNEYNPRNAYVLY